ncbi:MAG: sugar phosphate isomerase/epimerase [Verrucomicrobia bacterium]|nr:sugar phosphate isomerase/epimerase [Verrucomicrobiota bacterium]
MTNLAFDISPYSDVGARMDELLALGIPSCGIGELYPPEYYQSRAPNPPVEAITREIKKRNLKVVSVHGIGGFVAQDPAHQPEAIEKLKRQIDVAAEWMSPVVVFHFRQPAMPWEEVEMAAWTVKIGQMGIEKFDAIFHETLARICDYAATRGVTVHLEAMGHPFSYGHSVEQIIPTLKAVNHKNLGVCADSGHLHCSGHDPAGQIRLAKGFPLALHLNDNFGPVPPNYDIYDSDLHLVPGLGTINWPRVILALREVNYSGPMFFEGPHFPGGSFREGVELTIRNWRIFESLADKLASRG